MADPDAAATAAAEAILACPYPKVGEGTARNFASAALRAARPLIDAEARASERQRIITDLRIGDKFAWYRDAANPIADLLDGDGDA